jgi:methanogenic corrinoid protein MtbC1
MAQEDEQLLRRGVISCDDDEMIKLTRMVLERNIDPEIIARIITDGLAIVGEKFEKGEIFLPELMLAGQGAIKSMALVNEEILKKNMKPLITPAKVVIGTVEGDVHNIGKDIVGSMLMAAGFEVHDLGVNVSASQFFFQAETVKADIVAISALMTTTIIEQEKIIKLFEEKGKRGKYKILIGGGATSRTWAQKVGADGYGADAGEALKIAKNVLKS